MFEAGRLRWGGSGDLAFDHINLRGPVGIGGEA
jgi:hypothetical protein